MRFNSGFVIMQYIYTFVSAFLSTSIIPFANCKVTNIQASQVNYLHTSEYPDDDFSHILGFKVIDHTPSKLQLISADRIKDVILSKSPIDTQGCGIDRSFYLSSEDLESEVIEFDEKYGEPVDIQKCILSKAPKMAIAAEFKRASPSKGDININVDCVEQCSAYARIGAAIISVLTEFKHFKGTLADMKKVRLATQKEFGPKNRPAILRKDFVFDRYQILEARVNGADTILLIVACLGVNQLKDLIQYARKMKMEPLVEVHTQQEMEIAILCKAKMIGVNNRNLHTFQLDLDTTEKALQIARNQGLTWQYDSIKDGDKYPDITVISLSGVTSSQDVQQFQKLGVSGVLVGEALMKSSNPREMITQLLSNDTNDINTLHQYKLIKICGFTQSMDVEVALQNNVNLIGVIFAKSSRSVTIEQANSISSMIRKYGERNNRISSFENDINQLKMDKLSAKLWYNRCADVLRKVTLRRPLCVGVFQDQSVEYVNEAIDSAGLDLVQLHGNESPEYARAVKVPCIKVIHATPTPTSTDETITETTIRGFANTKENLLAEVDSFAGIAIACLLDSRIPGTAGGGTGQIFDWSITDSLDRPFLLAGGLDSENVQDALKLGMVIGVDVSSGVESSPGVKNLDKLKHFTKNARSSYNDGNNNNNNSNNSNTSGSSSTLS